MHQRFYIFSILLFISWTVPAQEATKKVVDDGFGIRIDYGKLLTLPTDFEQKLEIAVDYQFQNKLILAVHLGSAIIEPKKAYENAEYKSQGIYGRLGVNYLIPIDQTNLLYVGVKFALAQFEDEGSYTIESELWPDFTDSFNRNDLSANWFEFVIGSEKTLKNPHWKLGGLFSIRKLNDYDTFEFIDVYTIPGYGRTQDSTVPAVNLYIKYKL